jgi:hypothetical protein
MIDRPLRVDSRQRRKIKIHHQAWTEAFQRLRSRFSEFFRVILHALHVLLQVLLVRPFLILPYNLQFFRV